MQATDTMLSVLLRYTENLWDGIMKNPELTKDLSVVNLWEIVYTGLRVPAKLISMLLHVASEKIMFSKSKSNQVLVTPCQEYNIILLTTLTFVQPLTYYKCTFVKIILP